MNDQMKLASAVLAGYLIGRTKQGKRALRLALWLGGGSGGVAGALAQQARTGLGNNAAVAPLLQQVRGPLAEAGRKALTSALEQRANALADALHQRTEALAPEADTVPDAPDSGTRSARDDDQPDDEPERSTRTGGRTGRGTRTTARSRREPASTETTSTGRDRRTAERGAPKRTGGTRGAGRSTGQRAQSGRTESSTGSRSRGGTPTGSTRRRSASSQGR